MKGYLKINLLLAFFCSSNMLSAQLNPLFIPPTLSGPVYNLNMQNGTYQFNPGITSQTMGFNGNLLGPTLIMNAGQQVSMNVTNSLGENTTVHWHGLHVAAENDGGPHTVIAPNTTWTPSFTVMNHASTYWYHPHLHDSTHKHVAKGLAGLIIVRDAEEAALALPRTYGVDDFPLIIQTRAINSSGQIQYMKPPSGNQGPNMDTLLTVNGIKNATLNVPAQSVRLRILNGSNQRVFNLGLSTGGNFYQIASDDGLLAQRASITRLKIAPGERAEIVIPLALTPVGTNIQLMSYASELPQGVWGATNAWIPGAGSPGVPPNYNPNPMNGTNFSVLNLHVVESTPGAVFSIPPFTLASVTPIPEASATNTRHKYLFSAGGLGVKIGTTPVVGDAQIFNMGVIDDVIPYNATEIWVLHGSHQQYHPFHIHDIEFFILDRRDSNNVIIPLTPNERGRKDVVFVGAKETVRFITKFTDFWGDVPFMYHCHITGHEDMGMMKQFIVTQQLYVDKNYVGVENGSFAQPFNTVAEAVNAATDGTTIYFKSFGDHNEISATPITTLKKITFKPYNVFSGAVIIK